MDALDRIWDLIYELHKTLGLPPLKEVEGCWGHQLTDHWLMAVNGHDRAVTVEPDRHKMRATVPAGSAVFWFNGWVAAQFDFSGGWIAKGELANTDTLIIALEAAVARAKMEQAPVATRPYNGATDALDGAQ